MSTPRVAAHILANKFPALSSDAVSQYVAHLKEKMGPTKSSAVYSMACRAAPIAENPMGLQRGSVVEIEGEKYISLGCGFMTLEFASLERPDEIRTIGKDEFARLGNEGLRVLDAEESGKVIEARMG